MLQPHTTDHNASDANQMPAWEAARARNAAQSPIHRLPTEILLQIMQHLYEPQQQRQLDMFIFRQACFLFAQLFAAPVWQQNLGKEGRSITLFRKALPPFPFPIYAGDGLHFRLRLHACRVRCATCAAYRADKAAFAARIANLQHPLNCRLCAWQHPAIAFAPSQRTRRRFTFWRSCIANSGCVPICPHKSFKMRHLRSFLLPPANESGYVERLSERVGRTDRGWEVLGCKACFEEFAAPGQRQRLRPTVFAEDNPVGTFTIRWTVPLARAPPDGDCSEKLPAEAILARLTRLEERYRALIGSQSSFLSDRIRHTILDADPSKTGSLRLHLNGSDKRKLYLQTGEDGWFYLECATVVTLHGYGQDSEVSDYTAFIPFVSPETIELEEDAETRHVTWCPDAACGTGKGWDAHLLTVRSWDECARDGVELRGQWETGAGGLPLAYEINAALRVREKKAEVPYVPFPGTAAGSDAGAARRGSGGSWFMSMVNGAFGK